MMYNLKNIKSFILNSYIKTINDFVGEEVIEEVDEKTAEYAIEKDVWSLLEKLAHKIKSLNK